MKLQLDWASLPKLLNWTTNQPNPQLNITVAIVFRQRYAVRVAQLYLWESRHEAMVQLCEVASMEQGLPCPAD